MKFKIYQDQAGLFRWRLVARNGRIRADSGEGYSTLSNCRKAISGLNYDIVMLGHWVDVEVS